MTWALEGKKIRPGRSSENDYLALCCMGIQSHSGLPSKRGLAKRRYFHVTPRLPMAKEARALRNDGRIPKKKKSRGGAWRHGATPARTRQRSRHNNRRYLDEASYKISLLGPRVRLVRVKHRSVSGANRPRVCQPLAVGGEQDLPVGLEPHRVDADEATRV